MRFLIFAAICAATPADAFRESLSTESGCLSVLSDAARMAAASDIDAWRWALGEAPNAPADAVAEVIAAAEAKAEAERRIAAALMLVCQSYSGS